MLKSLRYRSGATRFLCAIWLCVICAAQSSGVWLDVPFVRQEKNGCGAASIAMVMQYWQQQPGQRENAGSGMEAIQQAIYSSGAHGAYASDMERYFQGHGFRTFAFRGQWADLRQHLAKGRPLIVALKPLPTEDTLHYVVVAGIDLQQNVVLVNDAAQRKLLKEDCNSFEKKWSAAGNWTLLALPETAKP
ncbi:MAG TPA: C39 family peptidase [Candidatus Angelobacter sp.]|nr:C39 family peptidase [Candidatus Angelobacter sp.]